MVGGLAVKEGCVGVAVHAQARREGCLAMVRSRDVSPRQDCLSRLQSQASSSNRARDSMSFSSWKMISRAVAIWSLMFPVVRALQLVSRRAVACSLRLSRRNGLSYWIEFQVAVATSWKPSSLSQYFSKWNQPGAAGCGLSRRHGSSRHRRLLNPRYTEHDLAGRVWVCYVRFTRARAHTRA